LKLLSAFISDKIGVPVLIDVKLKVLDDLLPISSEMHQRAVMYVVADEVAGNTFLVIFLFYNIFKLL
jgi:hypothetical protein